MELHRRLSSFAAPRATSTSSALSLAVAPSYSPSDTLAIPAFRAEPVPPGTAITTLHSPPPPPAAAPFPPILAAPLSHSLPQPAWYDFVGSATAPSVALTSPLPPWSSAVSNAPSNVAMLKARSFEASSTAKFARHLLTMSSLQGQVASTYPRMLQCLVDAAVSFFCLSGGTAPANAVHADVYRYITDALSGPHCPQRLLVISREAENDFALSGVGLGHTQYYELLLRHVILKVVRELLPVHESASEIAFNAATCLSPGESILDFASKIRSAAVEHSVEPRRARMRLADQVQGARAHPGIDRNVHNAVVMCVDNVIKGPDGGLGAFVNEIRAQTALGGFLGDSIIRLSSAPPLGFIGTGGAGAPPPPPPPPPPPFSTGTATPGAGSPPPSALLLPDATALLSLSGNKRCWDLVRIYPLLGLAPVPDLRGSRDCLVCTRLLGKKLIPWAENAPRPDVHSGEKWAHDPWFCYNVGVVMRDKKAAGDDRFTADLLGGVERKPPTVEGFPTPA